MLFNSYEFIFLFLPICLVVFYKLGQIQRISWSIIWLVVASLFFYGWSNPSYLYLIIVSISINYIFSLALVKSHTKSEIFFGNALLIVGLIFNLIVLAYYKYSFFLLDTLNSAMGSSFQLNSLILPLGISFYTFQQIAYLVDAREGQTKEYSLVDYLAFILFFPKLIAGPIVTHREIVPQFSKLSNFQFDPEDLAIGLTIFVLGLFKKVVVSDSLALYATPAFEAASHSIPLTIFEAWCGAIAFNLQIYFDFSGYSDMAIGVARMFKIKLPINFNSPFKAVNIIDFWSRWHMTLTRFLNQYIYNPIALFLSRRRSQLGKSLFKKGIASPGAFMELVAVPTLTTMLIAGFWHGAGWQYIIMGLLHGIYLVINQAWHMLQRITDRDPKVVSWWGEKIGLLTTFLAVVVGHVFFRAKDVNTAGSILASMFGLRGISLPTSWASQVQPFKISIFKFDGMLHHEIFQQFHIGIVVLLSLMIVVWFFPNTQQWMYKYEPALGQDFNQELNYQPKWLSFLWKKWAWKPNNNCGFLTALIALLGIFSLANVREFIYFKF